MEMGTTEQLGVAGKKQTVDRMNGLLDYRGALEASNQCAQGALRYFIIPLILSTAWEDMEPTVVLFFLTSLLDCAL